MGRGVLGKRRARSPKSLKRGLASRDSYEKVLIVCEGEKTEPTYFRELVSHYRLNSANVEVDTNCGSSPKNVFRRAVELFEDEKKIGDPYDRVFCVFDKDSHSTYAQTMIDISRKRPAGVFFATNSVPCFEYWLLLHFVYTTRPYARTGKYSVGDQALKDLQKEFPEYKKGAKGVFHALFDRLGEAKNRAIKSLAQAQKDGTDNPSTYVHTLVDRLQNLKQ